MIYFGSQISPNQLKTDEGFLYAMNVPIARTGVQKYLPSEVPIDGAEELAGPDGLVPVYREPEEVFSPATIASFEGKPVSDGHPSTPDAKIHAEDIGLYGKGHIQYVRRGTGDEVNDLVADLVINDPSLVDQVENNGKREISCGYDCDWALENGKVYQRNITGNHVAVVPRGRAGSGVAIKDEKPKIERRIHLAKENFFKHAFGLGMKEAVKDADPEDVAELFKKDNDSEKEPAKDETPVAPAAPAAAAPAASPVEAKLDKLIAMMAKLMESKVAPEHSAMDDLENATATEARKEGESLEQEQKENSGAIDSAAVDCGMQNAVGDAAVTELIKQLKPSIAKIPDKAVRDSAAKICLDALHSVSGNPGSSSSVYGQISQAVQTNKAKAAQDAEAGKPMTIAEKNAAFIANCKKAAEESTK